MKTRNYIYLAITLIALGSCSGTGEQEAKEPEIPVSVTEIATTSIEKIVNTNGTVLPIQKAELKSEITGYYQLLTNPRTGRPYKLGDVVKESETIIRLNDPEYENSIAIESKKLNLELTQQEFRKQESLFEKGGVTQREIRNAEVNYINAKYDFENAQLRLAKTKVSAPFEGAIVDLPYYTPSVRIASGLPVLTLMEFDEMYLEFSLPEKHINELKPGMDVRITSYNLAKDTLWGKVADISPAISAETRTFKGRVSIKNPKLLLKPGMFVSADVVVSRRENTIVISKEVLMRRNDKVYVFIAEKSIARQQEVSTGVENAGNIEVTFGLNKGDRLVTKGFETLKDNSQISVIR